MSEQAFYSAISLLSAFSWALGAIFWRKLGQRLSATSMNLGKSVIGSVYLGVALVTIFVAAENTSNAPVEFRSIALLALSGILGIAIGDTFFFKMLLALGPRRASLIGAMNPVIIALGATFVLGERPTQFGWLGIALTTLGVGWVVWERAQQSNDVTDFRSGVTYGLLFVGCTSAAILMAKLGISSLRTLEAAWLRLAFASFALIGWSAARSEFRTWTAPLLARGIFIRVAAIVAVTTVGGFWLSLVALKHLDASIAATLGSTSPLFILPLSALLMKERLSVRSVFGTAIAIIGVSLN